MATARAIANGNWSSTSTWNGGVLPGNGDTVYANGFNVTINQNITIGGANNPTVNAGSLVSGQWYEIDFVGTTSWTSIGAASSSTGTAFLATGVGSGTGTAKALATLTTAANTPAGAAAGGSFAMSATFNISTDLRPGTTTCLTVTGATNATLNGVRVLGGSATNAHGCNYNSTGTLTLQNSTFTGSAVAASALNNATTGTISIEGGCQFNGGTSVNAVALNNTSTGSVTVSGSNSFTAGSTTSTFGLNNASTGSITITGSCTFTGGSANAVALNNNSGGSITVNAPCTFTAGSSSGCFALNNASTGTIIVAQSTFTASAFVNAVSITNTSADVRLTGDFLDHWSGWKAVSGNKWRLGATPTAARTRYALAGTTDSYVTMFTADNTGFGLPAATDVRSGVSYGGGAVTGLCAVPAAGSVALGVPIDNTTGTAVLTIANVQSALTSQGLTSARAGNLENLDTTVSSRLAPSGTLATVTTLTNAPASVTPAQIRAELDTNSTKLAAIKSKTDLLNTDRLAQCATTSIVGSLIAQSNS